MYMTPRQRLAAVMHKERADRLAWTTLVDGNTLGRLPDGWNGISGLEFYRRLGCDIFMLDCWDRPYGFKSPVLKWPEGVSEEVSVEGEVITWRWKTPERDLTRMTRKGHPIKYPVQTVDDVDLYRRMWAGACYVPADDRPVMGQMEADLGEDGVITRFWGPTTIPQLLELDIGTINFYYMLHDHPQEIEALIATIDEKQQQAFRILAEGPYEYHVLAENTSTFYISPPVYRKYNRPAVKAYVDTLHAAGKTAIIHMCGHVRGLLHDFKAIGFDGMHAITPPPTGDTPWELALDVLGDDMMILGALDPTIWVAGPIEDIGSALDALYTKRLRDAHFILCPFADGIPVELPRFQAIAAWMEKNGAR